MTMPLKIRLRKLLFWRGQTKPDTSLPQPTTIDANDFASLGIIHSARNCPFTIFEDCIVDSNYNGLGNAPESSLQAAWLQIYSEYVKLCDLGGSTARIKQMAAITSMSAEIDRVKSLCMDAIHYGGGVFIQCLQDSGYKFVKSISDIKKVVAQIKRKEMQLSIAIKNLPKDSGDSSKITREYFDDMIASFMDKEGLGVSVIKEQLTVAAYCALYRRLSKKIENHNKKLQSNGRRVNR